MKLKEVGSGVENGVPYRLFICSGGRVWRCWDFELLRQRAENDVPKRKKSLQELKNIYQGR